MKYPIFYLLATAMLCSCSHRVTRLGYTTKKKDYWDCDVPVRKNMKIADTLQKIGELTLGDCKSKIYTEEESVALIKKEGCANDADLVNIVEENSKDQWSTCYKCRAEFYIKKKPDSPDYKVNNHKKLSNGQAATVLGIVGFVTAILVILVRY